ncbi:carboxylating nicotinate-nucleotide diphosphorylase [Pseudokineococcus basanitobsidens]|uniref:nicotinate-nucleotide diphosphorylase (carboxylating) n=1 Tax=Pseudokineococcus basanitobsidens TaxID=1926649 RepID=A0ABU8RKD3_9ACTN
MTADRRAGDVGAAPVAAVEAVVAAALAEDAPWGDATTEALLGPEVRASARVVAREDGVLAELGVLAAALHQASALADDPRVPAPSVRLLVGDGERFTAGQALAEVEGSARAVLRAERVALNLLQRLSGVATLTAAFVAETAGTRCRVVDTRKTTPGLRQLERAAVRCGGGRNHRTTLSDAVMVKDNHLAVLTADGWDDAVVTAGLRRLRERLPHTTTVTVEVDRLDQLDAVLAAGVDVVLLDNMGPDELRRGVERVAGRALVEASGGVRLGTVGAIARAGVDLVSVGALTQAAPCLDLGLDVHVGAPAPRVVPA